MVLRKSSFALKLREKRVLSNAAVDSRLRTGLYAERVTHGSRFSGTKISEPAYTHIAFQQQGAICALVGITEMPGYFPRSAGAQLKTKTRYSQLRITRR